MASWIEQAEQALEGRPVAGVEVIRGKAPSLLGALSTRGLMAPWMAALLWAAAVLREQVAGYPLDPWAVLVRMGAYALTVRSLLLLVEAVPRFNTVLRARQHALVLTAEGLLFRSPRVDRVVRKQDIAAVVRRGHWHERPAGALGWAAVFVVLRPGSGDTHLEIPPLFGASGGAIAEMLMRWRGTQQAHAPRSASSGDEAANDHPAPAEVPSRLYDEAVHGQHADQVTVISHGALWWRRGPYVTFFLGLAVLDGIARMHPAARQHVPWAQVLGLVALLLVVPLWWMVVIRRQLRVRRGAAVVLTRAELLLRTRAGVMQVPWQETQNIEVVRRWSWSALQGLDLSQRLVVERDRGATVRIDEVFMEPPVEVVHALCDMYRRRL